MVRTTVIFGICVAILLIVMQWIEYSFFIRDISLEIYLGLVGIICLVLGVWMGKKYSDRVADEKITTFRASQGSGTANLQCAKRL